MGMGQSAGPDSDAQVVDHQARLVISQATLEIKGGSGVVVALMCGLVGVMIFYAE
jgi:hypothetical protein